MTEAGSDLVVAADAERLAVARLLGDLQAVRDIIAPKATDAELRVFAQVAGHVELDPFAGEICLIGRWESGVGRTIFRPNITVAGRRVIAARTGRLRGIDGPYWCGPRPPAEDCLLCQGTGKVTVQSKKFGEACPMPHGQLLWRELWDDDAGPPYAARCLVHVDGWDIPANGTAKWSEFAQEYKAKTGELVLMPTWLQMPSHMLGKVAEALALRRGFPEVLRALEFAGGWLADTSVDGSALEPDDASVLAEASAEPAGAAPGPRQPVERRRSARDRVPDHVYDNEPEAYG